MMLSAPEDADLLNARNWTASNHLPYQANYLEGKFRGWLEGCAVVDHNGEMLDMLRVDAPTSDDEFAAIVHISRNGKKATFDPSTDFIKFPGGSKKFIIQYDSQSHQYWSLVNYVKPEYKGEGKDPASIRNTIALVCSPDLRQWTVRAFVFEHPDTDFHAYQYLSWLFEGNDIILVSRTAFDDEEGGAHNNHDANYMTFYRIKDFRHFCKP